MKKTIVYLLLFAFLLSSLAACKPSKPKENDSKTSTGQTENNPSDETSPGQIEDKPSNDTSNEEKYKSILDIYKDVVMNLDEKVNSKDSPYPEGTKEYEWESAIIVALTTLRLSTNVPGYAFCDLNKNGNDEMLLLLDDYTVLAIFSFADGKPVLLDNYWNRKKCTIEQDGTIQVYGSGGADTSSFSMFKISDNDKELVLLEEYGTDGHDPETLHPRYYKISNGNKTPITALEYAAALSQGIYSSGESLAAHTKENASFEFVPLELDYKRVFEKILNYEMTINSENRYLWYFLRYFGGSSTEYPNTVRICYLDMDGDGIEELLLRGYYNDYIMLRYQSGSVYLYNLPYKSIDRVYEDGSYGWHSPTYLEDNSVSYGVSRVYFNENEQKFKSIYTIYDGDNESYFTINGKLASKGELDALIESRENIKEVIWTTYTLDPNKIPAKG